ncbi:glycerophosphodiester phosphodiesterase [Negadavirga shengliensis]|uniref:Glycerophosphodiester phosphodiesterase n=1 Tax=Negadavirga shengliensis TaxID=1389218 RepID=A0ABV9SXM2_9BACT
MIILTLFGFQSACCQSYDLPERGLCAHRGAMTAFPENTIPALQEAVRLGAHMIEFDVQFSKDSALVIMHDASVDRTTDGIGKVADLTLEEIKRLDAGSWKEERFSGEKVPVLDEVLDIMPRNVWLNIHIKGGKETGKKVAENILRTNRQHQAVLAVEREAAAGARSVSDKILICNMERQSGKWDYVDGTIAMKADFIQLRGEIFPKFKEYVQKLHSHGIKVNYFGTDEPEKIRLLWDYGVDFPLVNDINRSIKLVENAGVLPVKPQF